MNWPSIKRITHLEIGRFLALMLIVWLPFMGGPRLPSLLLAIMGIWLLWTRRATLFASVPVRRLVVIFALLWIPMVLSVPTSSDWRQSGMITFTIAVYFIAGLALVHALRADSQRLWLAKWLTIAALVWLVDGLIQYLVGYDLLGDPTLGDGRLTGFFRGNLSLSTILAILLPIPVWYMLTRSRLAMYATFVGAGIIAVLVATRNAVVMMSVVALGTMLRLPRRDRWGFVVVALAVAAAIGLSPALEERLQRVANTNETAFEHYDYILSGRLTIWETASHMVLDRPLTGVGIGMFAKNYDRYSTRPDDIFRTGGAFGSPFHTHNIYLSIAAETGLVGLFGMIIAFVLCVKWYYAALPSRREQAWPYSFALLIAMFPLSVEYSIYKHWIFAVPLLLLCAMLAALGDEVVKPKVSVEKLRK